MIANTHDQPSTPAASMSCASLPQPLPAKGISVQTDYLNLPGVRTISAPEEGQTIIIVKAELAPVRTRPTKCKCENPEIKLHNKVTHTIMDEPRGSKIVRIELTKHRYICKTCGKTEVQTPTFTARGHMKKGHNMTQRLYDLVKEQSLLRPHLEVAQRVGLSARTVRDIYVNHAALLDTAVVFKTPRVLGLDGVRINGKQCIILTDIEAKHVIDVIEGAGSEQLIERLRRIPDRERIEIVTIDMCRTLRKAVRTALPHAVIVTDRYHIQRMGNKAMDQVRTRLYKVRKEEREPGQERPRPETFRMRRHRLKSKHQEDIAKWRAAKPELGMAFDLKEQFLEIWDLDSYESVVTICSDAARARYIQWEASLPGGDEYALLRKAFKPIITAMTNWGRQIFNYFDYRYTNAFTESSNRKIKDGNREMRGCNFTRARSVAVYGTLIGKLKREAREQEWERIRPRVNRKAGRRAKEEQQTAISEQTSSGDVRHISRPHPTDQRVFRFSN